MLTTASVTTNEDINGVIGIRKLKKLDKTMAKRERTSNTTIHIQLKIEQLIIGRILIFLENEMANKCE
jgi:hypothetical protein